MLLPHLPVTLPAARGPGEGGHPLLRRVFGLVDGKRTLGDIAALLRDEGLLPAGVSARDATGALLLKLHGDRSAG